MDGKIHGEVIIIIPRESLEEFLDKSEEEFMKKCLEEILENGILFN